MESFMPINKAIIRQAIFYPHHFKCASLLFLTFVPCTLIRSVFYSVSNEKPSAAVVQTNCKTSISIVYR